MLLQGPLSGRILGGAHGGISVQLPEGKTKETGLSPDKDHLLTAMHRNSAYKRWHRSKHRVGGKQFSGTTKQPADVCGSSGKFSPFSESCFYCTNVHL